MRVGRHSSASIAYRKGTLWGGRARAAGDADFIVERTDRALNPGLAKFIQVEFYATSDSQGDPDGDTHYHFNMVNSSGTTCANLGSWNNEAFIVYWDNYPC